MRRPPPSVVQHDDRPGCVGGDHADARRVAPERVRAQRGERAHRAALGRDERDQLALVGDAAAGRARAARRRRAPRRARDRGLVDLDAELARARRSRQRRRQAAARRVAHGVDVRAGREQRRAPARAAARCRCEVALELEALALRQDRDAVIADRARRAGSRRRAAPAREPSCTPGGTSADAGGVDEDLVAVAALDDLGVAGDDRDAGAPRGRVGSTRSRAAGRRAASPPRG